MGGARTGGRVGEERWKSGTGRGVIYKSSTMSQLRGAMGGIMHVLGVLVLP